MIICNEGLPRAGKSYDTMLTHILPALAAGRHVYARINGLDDVRYERIAERLKLPVQRIRELLIHVAPGDVHGLFVAVGDDPPKFRVQPNSLVVIDEVHEYYVSDRRPLPTEREAFFGKHGHIGLDIVLMTQALKRLHSSILLRIQRKNVFTKLSALGKDDSYNVRLYHCPGTPGHFEKLTTETHKYDPSIFPLYDGFQPEATNTGAYKAGTKTVWQALKVPVIAFAAVLALGVFAFGSFFFRGGSVAQPAAKPAIGEPAAPPPPPPSFEAGHQAKPSKPEVTPEEVDLKAVSGYPPAIRQLLLLGSSTRPRLAGTIGRRHVLEWRSPQGQARERLTSDQLASMGWMIEEHPYGIVAIYADRTIVFTAWPLDQPFSQSSATAQNIRVAGQVPLVSAPAQVSGLSSEGSAGIISAPQQPAYGGIGYGTAAPPAASAGGEKGT